MNLEYDTPVEVTQKQFNATMSKCSGIVCGQEEGGKYFIKLWVTKYRSYVKQILEQAK